jgi:hypothetical protein
MDTLANGVLVVRRCESGIKRHFLCTRKILQLESDRSGSPRCDPVEP